MAGARLNQIFSFQIYLRMAIIGAVDSIHEKRHPGGASFKESDSEFRKALKDSVRQHSGGLNHNPKRMTQSMRRIIDTESVHAEMLMAAPVHGQRAAKLFRFLIDGPVHP